MGSAHADTPTLEAAWSVAAGAAAVAAAFVLVLPTVQVGPLSWHMTQHIAAMNVLAPLAATLLLRGYPALSDLALAKCLWLATLLQMGLLWAWHSPPFYNASTGSLPIEIVANAALFLSALLFWMSVTSSPSPWSAMLALLVNGKLACLLGALLIFAPRLLICTLTPDATTNATGIDDQHLAGLLMIAACPLSYVLTAVVLLAQTLTRLERSGSQRSISSGRS